MAASLGWRVGSSDKILKEKTILRTSSIKVSFQLANQFQRRRFFKHFPIRVRMLKKTCRLMSKQSWLAGGVMGYNSERRSPSKTIPPKFGPNWPSSFRGEDLSNISPYGPMLKLCRLTSVVLVGRRGHRIKSLKGDHPRTIPPKFGPNWPSQLQRRRFSMTFLPNFLFLAMAAILVGRLGMVGYNSDRGSPKDHPCQVWSKLAQWFQRRRLKCEKLMD